MWRVRLCALLASLVVSDSIQGGCQSVSNLQRFLSNVRCSTNVDVGNQQGRPLV